MIKKFYFILLLFFTTSTFAQKTYIQFGKLIDGISNMAQTSVTIIADGNMLSNIKTMKNVTFVMKEEKIYKQ